MLEINKLNDKLVSELREIAQNYGIADADSFRKQELITKIIEKNAVASPSPERSPATLFSNGEVMTEEKPRKRARSTKSTDNKKHKEAPVDNTRLPEFDEEDEVFADPEPGFELSFPAVRR